MTAPLRSGFTTGTCAAAAARAAARCLRGELCQAIEVILPNGETVTLAIEAVERLSAASARASVIKDAGDDPDITDGMTVITTLELAGDGITFFAGEGVGTITSAGLQLPPGEPAINPVPCEMIRAAICSELGDVACRVTVSIPNGREVAAKTFNPRLGITGGLSILGTSGRVIPKSEEAWLRSLLPQIDVALAAGQQHLYLVPGGFGEQAALELFAAPPVAIIQTSNFIGDMLRACAERGVTSVTLVGHVGKLVKVAAGIFNTHSRFGDARLETITALAACAGAPYPLLQQLLELPTCESAISLLAEAGLEQVWELIADRVATLATQYAGIPVACGLVGYHNQRLGYSSALREELPVLDACYEIIGVGPGAAEWLPPIAWQHLRHAGVVVGGKRQLAQFAPAQAQQIVIGAELGLVMDAIRACCQQRVVVLASGDPGCFGILASLQRELPELPWRVLPGISSMQLALARLRQPWEQVVLASAHGRDSEAVITAVRANPRILALTDHKTPAQQLAAQLLAQGLSGNMTVLERLGYADERMTRGSFSEIAAGTFDPLAVVFIQREGA